MQEYKDTYFEMLNSKNFFRRLYKEFLGKRPKRNKFRTAAFEEKNDEWLKSKSKKLSGTPSSFLNLLVTQARSKDEHPPNQKQYFLADIGKPTCPYCGQRYDPSTRH